ncbi:hypothetical protein KVQ74_29045, partial [Pseudomonas sp. COW3]|nr:hypothetical protein [Pseudomonas botevensis]
LTAGKAVAFTIRPELIKGNEGGTVKASYHLERKNGRVSYSQVEAFNVGPQLDLKPPSIKEAPNDTNLDPFEAAKTLTAMVSYTGMQLADKITVTWAGTATPTGSHTTAPVTVTKLGTQEILLPEWLPVFNLGKAVTVSYSVVQGSSAAKPSQPRPLTVMPIANEEPRLPKPIILSAPNQGEGPELDVTTLTAPVNVRLYVWPHIYGQQRVWLHLAGRTNSGADYNKVIWNAAQVSGSWVSTGYADAALLLAELRALANNSTLTITFKATFDRDINENQAVTFPLRRYTIKNVADLKPAITRAEDSKGTEIAQGAVTVDAIVKLIGTATESQKVEVFDGTTSKGQATANAAGLWELRMTALSVAAHIFRARALYGSNLESDAKTLTVTALIVPTLVEVLDTAGVDIVNGGITTSTRLKLSGKASNAQRVEVFDGSGPSAVSIGIATTSAAGDWEISVPVLEGAHRFAAQSLYHPAPTYSNVRTLTVTGLIQPTLEYVRDTAGADIVDGAITISTTLKLSGKASNGQKVEIFDGNGPSAVSRGIATASAGTGDWELSVSVLEGAHRFAAQSLYHPAPTYSNVRTLTVTGLIQPTLEYVRDVAGADIDEGASTIDTTMKLSGKASKGQRVEIFDGYGTGAVSKGIATASPATGDWEIVITVETGARRLYGLSLYHLTLTYSNVRTLTVAALIVPVLEAVLDATDISIPDNGTTTSTTLKLSGKATNGQRVEVFDGDGPSAVSKGIVTANTATGDWQHVITVPEGARRLYAKSLYHGADVYSNVRYLTVVAMGTPIHENFDALAEVNLTAGVSITTANMVISCLEASGINKIKNTELSLQNIKGKVMDLNSMGRVRVRFELKGVYSEISFWHVMNMTSSNNTKIELYDLNAQLVSSTLIPAAQGWERQSTFNGTKFSRVEIVMASDWLVIDNIRISP